MTGEIPNVSDDELKKTEESWYKERDASVIDGSTLLVEDTPESTETLHYDEADEKFYLKRVEDVESTLEWCKGRYNEGLVNKHCEFRLVGSYPPGVISVFARKWGIPPDHVARQLGKDKDLTNKLLNDPDLSAFRTLAGRY